MSLFIDYFPLRRQRSTKLGRALELVTLVILILLFIWVAIDRIWRLRVEAERVHVVHTEAAIRVALGIFVAEKTAGHHVDQIFLLDRSNPVALLGELPSNYLGELSADEGEKVDGYHWYFDTTHRQLVYMVGNEDHFASALPGRPRAVYQLIVRARDKGPNAYPSAVSFAPVASFEWIRP